MWIQFKYRRLATPQRQLQGLRASVNMWRQFGAEAADSGGSLEIVSFMQREQEFGETVLELIKNDPNFDRFVAEAGAQQPVSINFLGSQFWPIWQRYLAKNPDANTCRDTATQLQMLLCDSGARLELANLIGQFVNNTQPGRWDLENTLICKQLVALDIAAPFCVDRAAGYGVVSDELQRQLGGWVVSIDREPELPALLTPRMVLSGLVEAPTLSVNPNVEFRRQDVRAAFDASWIGRVDVLRDVGYLPYLTRSDFLQVIEDVFRYAFGRSKPIIYHSNIGTRTAPKLWCQFIYRITGPAPCDWQLQHMGFHYPLGGKDSSSRFTPVQVLEREQAISQRVLSLRERLIRVATDYQTEVFDAYGRVSDPMVYQGVCQRLRVQVPDSILLPIFERMIHDTLIISPWTHETEVLGLGEFPVHARHELAWNFVEPKYDVEALLDQLLEIYI